MAEIKYLDLAGLGYYDGKIKTYIDTKVGEAKTAATEAAKTATEYDPQIMVGFDETGVTTGTTGRLTVYYNKGDGDSVQAEYDIPVVAKTEKDDTANPDTKVGVVSKNAADKWNTAATKADANEANITTLTTKVDGLVTAGGEPNKIENIVITNKKGNGIVDVTIADKTAKIVMDLIYQDQKITLQAGDGSSDIVVLGQIDATDFIKDGMLESAEIIEVPGDEAATTDRPAGKYIKLTWNTDAGQDPTYIPVADLLTEYTFTAGADAVYGTTNKLGIKLTASTTTLADGTKQTTYTPTLSETGWLTNVDNTLGALGTTYAAKSHTHAISEVTDLQTTLNTIKATADGAVQTADLKRIEDADIAKLFTA